MKALAQPKTLLAVSPARVTAERMAEITRLRTRRDEIIEALDAMSYHDRMVMGKTLRIERNNLGEQIEALEKRGDGGPLITVTLDAYASFLVRRGMAVHGAADPADVVNGALAFTCGEDDDHDWPEELHMAAERRVEKGGDAINRPAGHAVMIRLSPVQMRMFMQVADDDGKGSMADLVMRELGQHVALHLECYHSHSLEAARQRWNQEAKEASR